mmetsp:Transcript_58938/g.108891  ORF Transcript_58938/g.108891 Transcript_58938/m.108891 type:complete len:229 (-) Transcript_58938:162-848(-)
MGNRAFASECCTGSRDDNDMTGGTHGAVSAASQHEEEMVNAGPRLMGGPQAVRSTEAMPKRFLPTADMEDSAKADTPVPTAVIEQPAGGDRFKDRIVSGSDGGNGQVHAQDDHLRGGKDDNITQMRSVASDGKGGGEDLRWLNAVLNREGQEQLGLSISWAFPETCLTVSHVGSGAVERWNASNPEAAIQVGDAILSVNEISDPCEAAREMSMQSVVRLRLQRKGQEE